MTRQAKLTRREAMKLAGAAALGVGMVHSADPALARQQSLPSTARRRVLRVAHLTDIHVQPERKAAAGMAKCLHHVQSLPDRPDLILTGGDAVMDSFAADDARTQLQWDLWNKTLKDECSIPLEHCIGNHDVWGWNRAKSRTTGAEPNYGKQRAVENFGLAQRYRSFDLHPAQASDGGDARAWHCIVLDSTQPEGESYRAFIDPEQFDWLERILKQASPQTPVLVLSHIPILAASAVLWAEQNERGDYAISGALIHQDAVRIKDLFAKHPNVKLCLSGHLHHVDRVDYNGVTYLCNGAVSGNWWKGRHKDTDEGYAVVDLFNDGGFEHRYVKYGWTAAT